jgi:hypothetical protein
MEQLFFAVVEDVGSSHNEEDENGRNWYPQGHLRRKARYARRETASCLLPSPSTCLLHHQADNLGLTSKRHLTLPVEW